MPLIVAPMGLPGAGKSTVARFLVETLGLWHVDRDRIRHAMFPHCSYREAELHAGGEAAWLALEANCRLGVGSVLDGMTLSRSVDRNRLGSIADRHGFSVLPLFVDCPLTVARERVRADAAGGRHTAADRVPALVDAVADRFEPPPAHAARLDGALPLDALCAAALDAVREFAAQQQGLGAA